MRPALAPKRARVRRRRDRQPSCRRRLRQCRRHGDDREMFSLAVHPDGDLREDADLGRRRDVTAFRNWILAEADASVRKLEKMLKNQKDYPVHLFQEL